MSDKPATTLRSVPTLGGIVERDPADLRTWTGNPRQHPKPELPKLKANMARFAFTNPLLFDETNVVLSCRSRLDAVEELDACKQPNADAQETPSSVEGVVWVRASELLKAINGLELVEFLRAYRRGIHLQPVGNAQSGALDEH